MRWLKGYLSTLKTIYVEELVDFFLFRPIAYLLLRVFKPLPVTPNQVSLLAMLTGIAAGLFLARGNHTGFLWGGALFGLANVFDCLDGMIARVKGTGTKIGRLVDGMVDYIVSVAVFSGFAIGLTRAVKVGDVSLPLRPWLLVVLAGISAVVHAALTDKFRNLYEAHVEGKLISPQSEIKEFSRELHQLEKSRGKRFEKFMIRYYLKYNYILAGKMAKSFIQFEPGEYKKYNRPLIMMWNLIGYSTHITALVISCFLLEPMVFFYYTLVLANGWMLAMFFVQARANKKLISKIIETPLG